MAPELGSDKLAALRRFLATLPADLQDRLGEAVSHARKADPSFPADLVMEALHGSAPPPAAEAELFDRPAPVDTSRRYTLKELVCLGIEPFLTEEAATAVVQGRIPSSAVEPWWEAMIRMGVEGMDKLEADLAAEYEKGGDIAAFARAARRQVSGWSDRFMQKLGMGKTLVPELKAMFRENLVHEHVAEITRIMRCCEPILVALARIAPSGRVHELTEAAAEAAKPVYLAAVSRLGADSVYLMLALLNRLEKPWQIMRLARALGWTRAAGAPSRNAEMTAVCERLIPALVETAIATKAATAQRTLASGDADFAEVRQLVTRFAQISEALSTEVDFRKDSAWGAQIIKSREAMRSAFDAERLDIMENIIVGFMPSVLEAEAPPAEPAIAHAIDAARLLMAVVHHGERHGFASDASVVIVKVAKELERLTEMLLTRPHGHEPQLDGAVKVLSILYPDVRTKALAKRVDEALGRAPSS
jgi:hypothetical protein